MYGYVYLFTNRINGKKYVGQHKSKGIDQNYFGSGVLFSKAKKKYGIENFKFEILCFCKDSFEANEKEKYYIKILNTLAKNGKGYNLSEGGENANVYAGKSEEEMKLFKEYSSKVQKELWKSERKKEREMIGERLSKANKGVPKSSEHKEKISKANTNNKKKSTKVKCLETGIIYPSLREAERQTGISHRSISGNCKKISRYSYAGVDDKGNKLHWEFV